MKNIVWFRNDLRVFDNPALSAACRPDNEVAAVFVVSESQWKEHCDSVNKISFWFRCLIELEKELKKLNIPLMILKSDFYEDIPQKLLEFANMHSFENIFFNIEYPFSERKRDDEVTKVFENKNKGVFSYHDQVIHKPGTLKTKAGGDFSVYSPFKRCWFAELDYSMLEEIPIPSPVRKTNLSHTNEYDIYNYQDSRINQDLWPVGENNIQTMLSNFLEKKGSLYKTDRNFPSMKATAMSSPYLNTGVVSSKWCLNQSRYNNYDSLDEGDKGIVHWVSEILWREFYRHIIFNYPRVSRGKPFQLRYENIPWENNPSFISAWKDGKTGIPIVDAGIRQMIETGWMHNRLRMIVAMFLSKNLLVDWKIGEEFFMEHLIDGDIASNNGGWQWSASTGTDAAPYFRIMNPETQSLRFDEQGEYIRKHVKELEECPTNEIHMPKNPRDFGYVDPIVDLKTSRQKAIDVFGSIKKES